MEQDSCEGRVLIVDDEPLVLRSIERLLRGSGFKCTLAMGPEEALRLVQDSASDFDVVITDHRMPGMSGLELGRRLSVLAPKLPVVLLTGYSGSLDAEEVRESGVRHVIVKPPDCEVLQETVLGLING
jgi:two-component system cell cycle sensor histidine kinase/response regulator CckA